MIGSSWQSDSWNSDSWADNSWGEEEQPAQVTPAPVAGRKSNFRIRIDTHQKERQKREEEELFIL